MNTPLLVKIALSTRLKTLGLTHRLLSQSAKPALADNAQVLRSVGTGLVSNQASRGVTSSELSDGLSYAHKMMRTNQPTLHGGMDQFNQILNTGVEMPKKINRRMETTPRVISIKPKRSIEDIRSTYFGSGFANRKAVS